MTQLLSQRRVIQKWEAENLSTWTVEDLQNLATVATKAGMSAVVSNFMMRYDLEKVEGAMRTAALTEISKRTLGKAFAVGNHFTSSWTNGTSIRVTEPVPAEKKLGSLAFTVDTNTVEVVSTPIQMLPDEKDRKGLRFLLPIIVSWFKVSGQKVKLAINPKELAESMKNSVFDYRGIPMFADVVTGVFDPKTTHLLSGGRTLSGWSWVQHVKNVLLGCAFAEYYTLHTSFVYDVLLPQGTSSKKNYAELKSDKNFPEALNKTISELTESVGGCYMLCDAFDSMQSPTVSFTHKKTRTAGKEEGFARARAGVQKVRAMLGEALAHYRLIEDGRSYTSMMSTVEMEIVFLVSTALGQMASGKSVQIILDSVGPLEFIFTSLRKWQVESVKEGDDDPEFRFILPPKAATTVQSVYADYVMTAPEKGFVLIWNHGRDVAADSDIETALNSAGDVFNGLTEDVDEFIIKTGLYGSLLTDEEHSIYRYGTAWEFQGVVSTDKNLKLMKRTAAGAYYTVSAIKASDKEGAERAEDWYDQVKTHCTLMLSAPYRCPIYVSEACNLIAAQRERVKMKFNVQGDPEFSTLTSHDELSALDGFGDDRQIVRKDRKGVAQLLAEKGPQIAQGQGTTTWAIVNTTSTAEVKVGTSEITKTLVAPPEQDEDPEAEDRKKALVAEGDF